MSDSLPEITVVPSSTPDVPIEASTEVRREITDLIDLIKQSADKLALDGSSRGDLKIVSRALRELRYAFKVFAPYRRRRKVTIFGSARTQSDHPAYQEAVKLGRAFADAGWLVVTGAASGIMEAGHVGAGREHSMGLNILLPFEQEANSVIAGDPKLVHMKYFFTRKLMFVKESDAVVCMPGGFGTLDEAMEVLTLLQTGKRDMVPLVLVNPPGGSYWDSLHEFIQRELLGSRLISPDDIHLYRIVSDHRDAVREVLDFFRVYHSMRYVKNKTVLRLQQPPSDELLHGINERFSSLLLKGQFEIQGPLPDEADEPDLAHLARLVFRFNRRDFGKLRLLIDSLNCGRLVD